MGLARRERPLSRAPRSVRADHHPGLLQAQRHVFFLHGEHDHIRHAAGFDEDVEDRFPGVNPALCGDLTQMAAFQARVGGAVRDENAVPADAVGVDLVMQLRAQLGAQGRVLQARHHRLAPAHMGPIGDQRAEAGVGSGIGVHIRVDVQTLIPRFLDFFNHLRHFVPVAHAGGLQMADLHRNARLAPHLNGFVHRF